MWADLLIEKEKIRCQCKLMVVDRWCLEKKLTRPTDPPRRFYADERERSISFLRFSTGCTPLRAAFLFATKAGTALIPSFLASPASASTPPGYSCLSRACRKALLSSPTSDARRLRTSILLMSSPRSKKARKSASLYSLNLPGCLAQCAASWARRERGCTGGSSILMFNLSASGETELLHTLCRYSPLGSSVGTGSGRSSKALQT